MEALKIKKTLVEGDYTYNIMKSENSVEYIHINNHKTNSNSVLVPALSVVRLLCQDEGHA